MSPWLEGTRALVGSAGRRPSTWSGVDRPPARCGLFELLVNDMEDQNPGMDIGDDYNCRQVALDDEEVRVLPDTC